MKKPKLRNIIKTQQTKKTLDYCNNYIIQKTLQRRKTDGNKISIIQTKNNKNFIHTRDHSNPLQL